MALGQRLLIYTMETLDSSIIVLGWIGLIAVCALAIPTLYFWAMWVWEKILQNWPLIPKGHMMATTLAISLSLTKRPISYAVAYHVVKQLAAAERASPGLTKDLEDLWKRRSELE
jgi:hypothetical protein